MARFMCVWVCWKVLERELVVEPEEGVVDHAKDRGAQVYRT